MGTRDNQNAAWVRPEGDEITERFQQEVMRIEAQNGSRYDMSMALTKHPHSGSLRICGWILLVPFMLLTLLPAAVMPAQTVNGTMTLVLCTGDGPVETVMDLGGAPDENTPMQRCDWAAQAAAALLPDLVLPVRSVAYTRNDLTMIADLVRPAHDPHGVMARGPPTTL